ncbi:23S rRNA (uracil(1939)-C(5))-methyltransferase RlmD [Euhalothece natronophila Z-M001]|uniref:23S rRNA (Uracil(1939)-C(5))-methyltransferase RlmD n=1 Tax=Euhalothece natronophila Z-M001 TaxID=522448 RepID=A0A5B8NSF3_9CHRO|nr:23S rRNA (uracil(1939)-C(5))-methyltransferase RlmD [Euhalothece natronophila]QDZ41269.1 23S rRNA (uracil(1939)-C(5))-methyltransferase RlmD [Euhalothece natronophila Z-M001]
MSLTQTDTPKWQQGSLIEVEITDLSDRADGVGRWNNRVVFVPDTVTGDRALVRLVRVKPQYAYGKVQELLTPSPHRIRPQCIVADKCGGCQWQHIALSHQHQAKEQVIRDAMERLGNIKNPPIAPILSSFSELHYRNKVTYPLQRSENGNVQAGYYRKGSHKLVNLNQCPVQDSRLDPFLAQIKQDIEAQGWSIYNETRGTGKLRHLALRIGRKTGEVLLTLITTDGNLAGIESQAQTWLKTFPDLVGVCLNYNAQRNNVIFGKKTHCIAGKEELEEEFAGLTFYLRPDTFFQVNTETAEALCHFILDKLALTGTETVVDAYCGVGTFTLPLACHAKEVIGIESQESAIAQAQRNAERNQIKNVSFQVGKVENCLSQLEKTPDLVFLDPPRKGCDRAVIETLSQLSPPKLVYLSCRPATLARDLNKLTASGYEVTHIQPADFFPQTSHVEAAVFLARA